MLHRKNRNFHVVREPEDPTDEIIDRIMDELNSEDGRLPDMEEEIRKRKIKFRRKVILIAAAVIAAVVGVYLLINLQTYSEVRTVDTYGNGKTANNGYAQFGDGVLKYSRDGIAYLNQKGEEEWNQSYQIKTPIIDVCEEAAAVADKGGNDIVVFQEEGTKGEIHTTMPIEKINVSKQGIVSAILKGDGITKIMCYDTAGNVLVEHKTSLSGTGYPLDVTLSSDGETMQVLYLYTQAGSITSKVVYYNFGKAGEDKADHQVAMETYENTIMAAGFYMNDSVSVAVGDNCLVIYQGGDKPKERVKVPIKKEIKSVFHSEKYIGLVLKNAGKEGYELRLYNTNGKMVMSKDFTGDYNHVKICGNQVIMYDGKKCSIFMKNGIQKFEGEMNNNILEIFPIAGVNKYIVMNANGMEKVRLVK
ncbi:MAG: hypothetical protein KH449_08810 [Lachnospiraceae bacterium]|jgi:hypothetical protein|nr:hypothetical protein [Lachnospiraceae bacterium]